MREITNQKCISRIGHKISVFAHNAHFINLNQSIRILMTKTINKAKYYIYGQKSIAGKLQCMIKDLSS